MSGRRFEFTRARVEAAICEPGKQQTIYYDTRQPGLALRVTANGARSFVFEGKLGGHTVRLTIGPASMPVRTSRAASGRPSVEGADLIAHRWGLMVAQGIDPRAAVKAAAADLRAARDEQRRQSLLARAAWDAYLRDRKPHWSARHYFDHMEKGRPAGQIGRRGKTLKPGLLAPLLAKPLRELDAAAVEAWAAREGQSRPTSARLALRLLKAFLSWCAEQGDFAAVLPASKNPATSRRAREALGRPRAKSDALQREQLPGWFAAVRRLQNPVVAAYLQAVLLTGARPGELIDLQWKDVDFSWKTLRLRDKIERTRVVPLTPYVESLLAGLPRRNAYVFSGTTAPVMARPREPHAAVCREARIEPPISLHGLRRSFRTLSEWIDVPAGVVAQLMGHRPSATVERHYVVRPIDLLRVHAERIEAWIIEQARVELPKNTLVPRLAAVRG